MLRKSSHILGYFLVGSLAATSLVACGDDDDNTGDDMGSPDGGTDAEPLPPLEVGLSVIDAQDVVDLTPNGRTALLWTLGTGELFFYDVVTQAITPKTTLDTTLLQSQQPFQISANYKIASSYGAGMEPAIWSEDTGWVKLTNPLENAGCYDNDVQPPQLNFMGATHAITRDGTIAAGSIWQGCGGSLGFRYKDGVVTPLQKMTPAALTGNFGERVTAISDDGKIAGGFASNQDAEGGNNEDRAPVIWNEAGEGTFLKPVADGAPGEVMALSADGKVAVGLMAGFTSIKEGFIWTQEDGMQRFNSGAENISLESMYVIDVTADGKVAAGHVEKYSDPADPFSFPYWEAFMWSKETGYQKLADVAAAAGITLPEGQTFGRIRSLSDDGSVVAGFITIPPEDPNTGFPTEAPFVMVLKASEAQ